MIRLSKIALSHLILLFCTACTTLVPQQDLPVDANGLPTLETIITRVSCELWQTLNESRENYDVLMVNDVDVALQLSLTVTDSGTLAPNFTWIESPMLSTNLGINLQKSREQNHFQKLYYSMRLLDKEMRDRRDKDKVDMDKYCGVIDSNLSGNLGIRESVNLALTASSKMQWQGSDKLSASDGSFGGYVNIGLTKNLNMVGPTWMLRHFRGPGSLAGISEINADKITFAFARGSAAGKPFNYAGPPRNPKLEETLQQININQLTNQLGNLRQVLQ